MQKTRIKIYNNRNFKSLKQVKALPAALQNSIETAAKIFPFRVNNYVVEELINWDNIPDDPMFQLTFPQIEMLNNKDIIELKELNLKKSNDLISRKIKAIHMRMNPHPAGQMNLNVPIMDNMQRKGIQHKYEETVLFFPTHGQTCHSYCTYCFRWPQFTGMDKLVFGSKNSNVLFDYIDSKPNVTDLLFTGGDPMTMSASLIQKYLQPFIDKKPGNLSTIRFGTKALSYWPYKFFADKDSDQLLKIFESIIKKGYHLTIMAHFSHYKELETDAVKKAISRLKSVGAEIRCQAPLIRHINDDPAIWSKMWKEQVRLGLIPYYMFIERDTGPKAYFEVPLGEAYDLFTKAYNKVSGLCKTVRGPSMSANPGKIVVEGVNIVNGEKVFVLKFIQARKQDWVNKTFFAKYDDKATWFTDLKPCFGKTKFFFEDEFTEIKLQKEFGLDKQTA
ncbi:MAG: lysine 2,3-aminomutase [Desulfobacteraceae bacterium]|nr:lysine 2,3-aminomutase [Desulfobacteraceae bacterium]